MGLTGNNKMTSIIDNLFIEPLFGEDAFLRMPQSETEREIFTAEFNRQKKRMKEIYSDSAMLDRFGIINYNGQSAVFC